MRHQIWMISIHKPRVINIYFSILHLVFIKNFTDLEKLRPTCGHSEELEELQDLLHFPEEVALRLADTEYQLFYQVCLIRLGFYIQIITKFLFYL